MSDQLRGSLLPAAAKAGLQPRLPAPDRSISSSGPPWLGSTPTSSRGFCPTGRLHAHTLVCFAFDCWAQVCPFSSPVLCSPSLPGNTDWISPAAQGSLFLKLQLGPSVVPHVSGNKCRIFESGHRNQWDGFEKRCIPNRSPCVELNTQALGINLCKVMCGSADPGEAHLPVSPSKEQERPDIHVRLPAPVLDPLCPGREVTYPLLGERVTSLNKSWSSKTELGILRSAVPFYFICPGGTYGPNSLTSSLGPKSSCRWGRARWLTTAPTLPSHHGRQLGASSNRARPWSQNPPSFPLLARDYLTHAKEPRLSRQMTHRCYWIAVKTPCVNEQHDT